MHQNAGHRGVHAARQCAEHARIANLLPHLPNQRIGESGNAVGTGAATNILEKIAKDPVALRRVRNLSVELNAIQPARIVGKGGDGAMFRSRNGMKPVRKREYGVVVRHPDKLAVNTGKQGTIHPPNGRLPNSRTGASPTRPPSICAIICIP